MNVGAPHVGDMAEIDEWEKDALFSPATLAHAYEQVYARLNDAAPTADGPGASRPPVLSVPQRQLVVTDGVAAGAAAAQPNGSHARTEHHHLE